MTAGPGPSRAPVSLVKAVAEELAQAGVGRAFGVPGGENLALMAELKQQGIEFLLCNHESAAGFAATAFGFVSGVPGLVLSTLGPGACNLLLPIANAQLDRESLLAVCADVPTSWSPLHTHQRVPLLDIFRPVTKSCGALRPGSGRATLRRVLDHVGQLPHGAGFVTMSSEDAGGEAGFEEDDAARTGIGAKGPPMTADEAVERLTERLRSGSTPLVIVGHEVAHANAPSLRTWLERWQLPVLVTPKAKGLVDDASPRFLAVADGAGLLQPVEEAVRRADVLVAIGLDPVELIRTWHADLPIVWVKEPTSAVGNSNGEVLLTDHSQLFSALQELEPPVLWQDAFDDIRKARLRAASDPALPTWIPRVMREHLPPDSLITTDVGSHKCLFAQFWSTPSAPGFLTSNGLSAMGYGLPAALGAQLARPRQRVVAVVGDGGFAMSSQELETAVRAHAPITVLVLADGSLSLIRTLQRRRGLASYGVDLGPVDTVGIARGYGAEGLRVETAGELRRALSETAGSPVPVVIEVPLSPDAYDPIL